MISLQASWLVRLHEAQENYRNACRQTKSAKSSGKEGVKRRGGGVDDDATSSPLVSPIHEPLKMTYDPTPMAFRCTSSFAPSTSSSSRPAHSGRTRLPLTTGDGKTEEIDEEDSASQLATRSTTARRTRRNNRSSSSDAVVQIIGVDDVASRDPTTTASQPSLPASSRRISDPLRRYSPSAAFDRGEGEDGSSWPCGGGGGGGVGVGSDRSSSSVSVFSGPTTHVVVVTVHAADEGSPLLPRLSVPRPLSEGEKRENGDDATGRKSVSERPGMRTGGLLRPTNHHSSLKIRRRGAMKAIQEKSQSFDAIQI